MGLISMGYHLVPLKSPFSLSRSSVQLLNLYLTSSKLSKGHLPRPCLAKRCWGAAGKASILWSGPGTAHLGCRGFLDNALGALGWFVLPQLKVVAQE